MYYSLEVTCTTLTVILMGMMSQFSQIRFFVDNNSIVFKNLHFETFFKCLRFQALQVFRKL